MHARVCTGVPLSEQRWTGMWAWRACVCVEQKNVRPVKYLEIQLNYITAISLAREKGYFNPE